MLLPREPGAVQEIDPCDNSASLLIVLFLAAFAAGREYAPRVLSPLRADAYSMKTFAQFPQWRGLRGDALAWEVYKYLADTRSGLFHCNEVLEGDDALNEYSNVRDPVKIINVYGYAYCGILGPTMAGVWEDIGGGAARTVTLPGLSHVVAEVFYGGKWHYMDLDLRAVFRRPDGSLASLDEARHDRVAVARTAGRCSSPSDSLDTDAGGSTRKPAWRTTTASTRAATRWTTCCGRARRFTRWWTPQGGRWNHRLEWNREAWLRQARRAAAARPQAQPPRVQHLQPRQRAVRLPADLTDRSSDFADGAYDARNVRPAAAGLTLGRAGRGLRDLRGPLALRDRAQGRPAGHAGRGSRGLAWSSWRPAAPRWRFRWTTA